MTFASVNSKTNNKKRSSTEKGIDRGFIWLTAALAFAIAGVLI